MGWGLEDLRPPEKYTGASEIKRGCERAFGGGRCKLLGWVVREDVRATQSQFHLNSRNISFQVVGLTRLPCIILQSGHVISYVRVSVGKEACYFARWLARTFRDTSDPLCFLLHWHHDWYIEFSFYSFSLMHETDRNSTKSERWTYSVLGTHTLLTQGVTTPTLSVLLSLHLTCSQC